MSHALHPFHFDRQVVVLLGLPFDVVDMASAVATVRQSAASGQRCFISTPNLNFLMAAQADPAFRESVIHSDLSLTDGMPLVWLARLLRLPIRERVSGAGLFEQLCTQPGPPVSVYFFGGPPGIAERAADAVNRASHPGVVCQGGADPGAGSVLDMSSEAQVQAINQSQAQFVVVALGAKKGQQWIEHNRARLTAPVLCHLGAVVNFAAGSVDRAPLRWQQWGLEWLWRIKEEPALWRRYGQDGARFLGFLCTHLLPHAVFVRRKVSGMAQPAQLSRPAASGCPQLVLGGAWTQEGLVPLRQALKEIFWVEFARQLRIDLSGVTHVDSHFIGLVMLARSAFGHGLHIESASPAVRKIFQYHAADYLLSRHSPVA
ncbi:MAG: WecB/TagA/CpsF family glycosyltransferase [Pseudomonadota bacterium]